MQKQIYIILIIILVFMPMSQYIIKDVHATDYDIFTISDASDSVTKCAVKDNYLYVPKTHYIERYNLNTKLKDNELDLGASVTVTDMQLKGNILYLKINDGGVTKYTVISTDTFTQQAITDDTGFTNFNGELQNLAWIRYNGIDYWGWSHATVSAGSTYGLSRLCTVGYDNTKTYPRFVSMISICGYSTSDLTYTHYQYVHNDTAGTTAYCTQTATGNNIRGYAGFMYATLTPTKDIGSMYQWWYSTTTYYRTTAMVSTTSEYTLVNNDIACSLGYVTTRGQTGFTTQVTTEADNAHYVFYDTQDAWYRICSASPQTLRVASCTPSGFGSVTYVTLPYSSDIADNYRNLYVVKKFIDTNGEYSTYMGYIRNTNQPIAVKIVGSTCQIVGMLPETYSVTNARVYASDKNIVAVFVTSGTTLYVCRNLVEDKYILSSYGTNIIAQLYRIYTINNLQQWMYYIKFMHNNTYYTPLSGQTYYFYKNGIYQSTGTLDSNGMISAGFITTEYPVELSYYVNKSGYIPKWFNITLYSFSPISLKILNNDREKPILSLNVVDNQNINNLIIKLYANRFTGENWTNYYFTNNLKVKIHVETFGVGEWYNDYWLNNVEFINGLVSSTLAYLSPYNYRVTFIFEPTEQYTLLVNTTLPNQISFTYNTLTKTVTIGGYVSYPQLGSGEGEPYQPSPFLTPTLIINLMGWIPTLIIILLPAIMLLIVALELKASAGLGVILFIIGLNIGSGVAVWCGFAPFYYMLTLILLDTILFIFLLKSGGGGE